MPHDPTTNGVRYKEIGPLQGYCFGDDGTIWSRMVQGCRGVYSDKWRPMRLYPNAKGHLKVRLQCDGMGKGYFVHRLILEAFVGPCPDGMECCHNDGNPANNRLDNLRWDTKSANAQDAIRHGRKALTVPRGSMVAAAKLREADIPEIRRLREKGMTQRRIADMYGVTPTLICFILKGKAWAHV